MTSPLHNPSKNLLEPLFDFFPFLPFVPFCITKSPPPAASPCVIKRKMSHVSSSASSGGSGTRTVKKIVIKNFKEKPRLPENYEEETWSKLRGAIQAIHGKVPIEQSLEELYRACENLCFHNKQQMVYERLQLECEEHVKSELNTLLSSKSAQGLTVFLGAANLYDPSSPWLSCAWNQSLFISFFFSFFFFFFLFVFIIMQMLARPHEPADHDPVNLSLS